MWFLYHYSDSFLLSKNGDKLASLYYARQRHLILIGTPIFACLSFTFIRGDIIYIFLFALE